MFGIAVSWYVFRRLLPIPVDTYSFVREFKGVGYSDTVIVQTLIVFGVLLLPLWRAITSPVALSLIPFGAAQFLGGWFIGNVDRGVVQAAPLVIMALFASWPGEGRERILVLLPAGAYLLQEGLSQAGIPLRLILPPLFLVLVLNEIALARRWSARSMSGRAVNVA
jgi:hypothetical protein